MARRRVGVESSGYTILVVDDQDETLISSQLLLAREGHRVLTAAGGEQALALFRQNASDLLIIDYFMPRMSGEDLIKEIRSLDQEVQIILQTGYSGEKPPREMLKTLDIQGYHDKADGPDRFLLWVDVALKAAAQLRTIREHENELAQLSRQLRWLSAHLLTLQDEERERISRELHDQFGQLLTAIGLDLDWAFKHGGSDLEQTRERLKQAAGLVQQAIKETRKLCATLRPGDLEGSRLLEALKAHASEFERRSGTPLEFVCEIETPNLSQESGRNLFRIAQEALNNISRHASATRVKVTLARTEGTLVLSIEDNGRGFNPAALEDPHAVGLVGMRERALLIGGRLQVRSAPGTGTRISLEVPSDKRQADGC